MCGQYRLRGKVIVKYDEETEEYIGNVEELTGKIADLTKTANKPGGISLFKDAAKTEYKSTYELLKEISEIYHDLTDKQQAGLLEALAGKRGGQVLAGILEDFSEVEKAMTEMGQAAGSADDEMKIIEESISYKLNDLKETWIGLLQELLDRGAIDEIIDMLIKLSEAIVKVVEANPKAAFSGIVALLGVGKLGGFKGIADTISELGDLVNIFNKSSKSTKTIEELSEVLIKSGAAGETMAQGMEVAEVAMEGAGGAAVTATGEVGGLSGAVSALAGALGISVGALAAFAALAVAVGVGAVVAWDKFTITVEEAEEAVKKSESKVSDLKQKVEELESVENRTGGQEKRLELLKKQLKTAEEYLEVQKQIEYSERFGNKFSDSFDKENAYTQYKDDLGDRSTTDINQVSHSSYQGEAEDRISYINKYLEDLEKAKEGSSEATEATRKLDEEQDKARETLVRYLEETERYYERLNFVKEAIESGYLEEGTQAYTNAQEMIRGYTQIIGQNEHWIELLQKAVGDYDYVQDDIKQLASNWETGSISAENIADNLIDTISGFSEAEKAAFYDSIKNAKSYAEVLDIINEKQEILSDTNLALSGSDWNLKSALENFNIDSAAFEKYLEVFKELNPELAQFEEKCEQAAVEQYAFDQSVEDLRSHLNDYVENLETLDQSSVEYANSLQSITDDLSRLTGIDLSITDAQSIVQDTQNLELLRQALDGDNDALNRLRANVARGLYIEANAILDTEEFNTQYNELANWIAENPDIGTIEAQSFLDTNPFVKNCIELVNQGKMTADQLKAMFATLGWKVDFKEKTEWIEMPQVTGQSAYEFSKNASKTKNYKGYQGFSYKMQKVPVKLIDDIKFVDNKGYGSSRPKVTSPTSSSGSNYKPSQKSGGGGGGGGGGGSSKDPTDEAKKDEEELEDTYDEFFDYFERRLKVISDAVSLLDANLENVVGSKAKNSLLDAQMRLYKMQQQEYSDARDMYQEMADKALEKIPDDLREDVKNGAVAIDEFIGKEQEDVINAINDYTKWADKIAECKQQLAELKEQIRQLELNKMKNILQDWQDVFDLRQNSAIDLIDKQIALIEQTGEAVGDAFYRQQKSQSEKQLQALQKAKDELVAEFNRGLANGSIERGTDEWIEEVGLINQVEQSILDCKKAIDEFDNAILQIHTDVFERVQAKFDDFDDQLSDIASFIEDIDVGNKYGEWSKEGIARAGMLAQQYEMAQKRVADYSSEIAWLNQQYKLGKFSTLEYTEKLADLMSAQRDAAQDAKDYKDAIIDLNRARIDIEIDAIEKDIDAYNELIQKQKDALTAEKD